MIDVWGVFMRCLEGGGVSWHLAAVCKRWCAYAVWLMAFAPLVPRCLHQVPIVHPMALAPDLKRIYVAPWHAFLNLSRDGNRSLL